MKIKQNWTLISIIVFIYKLHGTLYLRGFFPSQLGSS